MRENMSIMVIERVAEVFLDASLGILRLQKMYGTNRLEAACGVALQVPGISCRLTHNILEKNRDKAEIVRNIDAFFFVIRVLCKDISNHWLLQKIRTSEDFCIKLAKILRRVSCTKKAQQRLGRMDSRSLPGTVDSFVTEFDNVFAKTRLYNYL